MAIKALKRQEQAAAPVISIMTTRALEQMLAAAGYQRINPSRFGTEASEVSVWSGKQYYVLIAGERITVGTAGSGDPRLRTTLRAMDCELVHLLKEDGLNVD